MLHYDLRTFTHAPPSLQTPAELGSPSDRRKCPASFAKRKEPWKWSSRLRARAESGPRPGIRMQPKQERAWGGHHAEIIIWRALHSQPTRSESRAWNHQVRGVYSGASNEWACCKLSTLAEEGRRPLFRATSTRLPPFGAPFAGPPSHLISRHWIRRRAPLVWV